VSKRGEAPLSFIYFPLSFILPRKERGTKGDSITGSLRGINPSIIYFPLPFPKEGGQGDGL
jgi:hypothetical protein